MTPPHSSMEEELDLDTVRHLLGSLADEVLGPRMPNIDHVQDKFQELMLETTDPRIAERWPRSMLHSYGTRINNHGLGDDRFAKSVQGEETRRYNYFSKLVEIRDLAETMTDPMMSQVFQDLVGLCSRRHKDEILVSLSSKIFPLLQVCCNPYGIRCIEKLFESLSASYQRFSAVMILSPFVTSLFKDLLGQAVIDFCLNNFSEVENAEIFFQVSKNLSEIAKDKTGCGMLIKCMEMSNGLSRDIIFCTAARNSAQLSVHSSGNYLVQRLFEFNIPWLTHYTLLNLRWSYHALSRDKYGSHVIEKCLSRSSRMQFEDIAEELMGGQDFTELFTDPYGNYVVQTMLDRAKDSGVLSDHLRAMIESKREQLQCNPHASGLLALSRKQKNRRRTMIEGAILFAN